MNDARRDAYAFGLRAETIATLWLRAQFYEILARNYRIQGGEIDIIARRGRAVVFVEVKARSALDDAATAITAQKEKRIARAANRWVATHPWAMRCDLRADAIFVAPGKIPRHIVAAFDLNIG